MQAEIIDLEVNQSVYFKSLGTTFKVLSESLNGSTAILEHTLESKSLGAPMHKHTFEDEISYVLAGELSVIQNGEIQVAGPGEFIVKPRGIFHTFWNAGNERLRFLEIITPGNFESYFAEVAPFLKKGRPPLLYKLSETAHKYGLIIDLAATDDIIEKYRLRPLS